MQRNGYESKSDDDYEFDDVKLMWIGTAEKNGNRAYFIVVNSEKLQEVRKKYGLSNQDFYKKLVGQIDDIIQNTQKSDNPVSDILFHK